MLSLYLNYKMSDNSERQARAMSSLVHLSVLCHLGSNGLKLYYWTLVASESLEGQLKH